MKVAVLGEYHSDEAAVRIIAEAVRGETLALIDTPTLRTRGWPAVRKVLPTVIKHLHYRTDAEGLIVVVDSDDSPQHEASHSYTRDHHTQCRLCQLLRAIHETKSKLTKVSGKQPLKIAVGLAIPSIEAWFQCGVDHSVSELSFYEGLNRGAVPYTTRQLKQRVYGSDRESLSLRHETMIREAQRLRGYVPELQRLFPVGFGSLCRDLNGWPGEDFNDPQTAI